MEAVHLSELNLHLKSGAFYKTGLLLIVLVTRVLFQSQNDDHEIAACTRDASHIESEKEGTSIHSTENVFCSKP